MPLESSVFQPLDLFYWTILPAPFLSLKIHLHYCRFSERRWYTPFFLLLIARLTHSWQIVSVLSVLLLQLALLYLTNWFQYVSYCLHFEFFQPILSFPDPSTKLTHGISWISLFLQYYCIILFESSNNTKKRTSLSWCSLTVVPSKLHTVNTFSFQNLYPKPLG